MYNRGIFAFFSLHCNQMQCNNEMNKFKGNKNQPLELNDMNGHYIRCLLYELSPLVKFGKKLSFSKFCMVTCEFQCAKL